MKAKAVQTDVFAGVESFHRPATSISAVPSAEGFLPCILKFLAKRFDAEVFELYGGNQAIESSAFDQRAGEIIGFAKLCHDQGAPLKKRFGSTLGVCARYLMHKFNERGRVVSELLRFLKVAFFLITQIDTVDV